MKIYLSTKTYSSQLLNLYVKGLCVFMFVGCDRIFQSSQFNIKKNVVVKQENKSLVMKSVLLFHQKKGFMDSVGLGENTFICMIKVYLFNDKTTTTHIYGPSYIHFSV